MQFRKLASLPALVVAAALAVCAPASPALAVPNCSAGRTLNIVAHQDDDLLFLSNGLLNDIQAGRCVRTIFVTAGDAGQGPSYWGGRELGAKDAYASMIGLPGSWVQTDAGVSGHPIPVLTHSSNEKVSLVFMRLPDGFSGQGSPLYGNQSLQKLWESTISTIDPVDGTAGYSRAALITTMTALMTAFQPDRIRTMDYLGAFGDSDHSDHHGAARFANAAHASYTTTHTFTGYSGYKTQLYPANVSGADLTAKQNAFYAYGVHDSSACSSASACSGSLYERWLPRQYVITTNVNLALAATATASSQDFANQQTAGKANDGHLTGYPFDHTKEWATVFGGTGSWLRLTWPTPRTINRILIYDRPNLNDHITAGNLTFSSGGTPVSLCTGSPSNCTLNNDGVYKVITFTPRTVTWVQLNITGVSGTTSNVGLAEIEVYNGAGP